MADALFAQRPGQPVGVPIELGVGYGMIEFLVSQRGERSLRELCDGLIRTRNLDRTLRRVYRANLNELESRFLAELG